MPVKILLADDSMTAQNMARKILSDGGYDIVTVSNGAAALKKIAEINPDLVILDIYMPGYSGFEVCERVKRSSERTLVLLSVGKLEPYREEDALAVRADGVIVKPFEATELMTTVQAVLQSQPARPPAAPPTAQPAGEAASLEFQPGGFEPPPVAKAAVPQARMERELPLEVSKLTEGLGSVLPPPIPEAPVPSAAPLRSAASIPGIEHLMPEQLHKRPEAAVVDTQPANRGHEPVAVPAFPVQPEAPVVPATVKPKAESPQPPLPEQAPAVVNFPFPEVEAAAAAQSAAPRTEAQPPSHPPATRLDAPAVAPRWRIEVRPTSPQPPAPGQSPDNDFSIELLSESELPGAADAAAAKDAHSFQPSSTPADPITIPDFDLPPTTAPGAELNPLDSALGPSEPMPAVPGGFSFSVPSMLEATAAMALPELHERQAAISTAATPPAGEFGAQLHSAATASARAEHRESSDLPLDNAVAEAVQRAMELYKPLIVAEITRELSKRRES